MWETTSPEADPNNPDGTFMFVAGTPVIDPETGRMERAATFDWYEKARLDWYDRARGNTPDPMNGAQVPVYKVARQKASERAKQSPLARRRARRAQGPPSTDHT